MTELPVFVVDAFTKHPFGGNQAAVCILEGTDWPVNDVMQKVAKEMNMAETAFCLKDPGEEGRYEIRWWTPELEMDLCGHATLASAHVILSSIEKSRISLTLSSRFSGDLEVNRIGENFYRMLLPTWLPQPVETDQMPAGVLEAVLGDQTSATAGRKVLKSRDFIVVLESEKNVADVRPNSVLLQHLNLGAGGICVTASTERADADFVSRFFNTSSVHVEDAVTGSAHCSLVPYWSRRLGRQVLMARQISERVGTLFCEDLGDVISVAGHAVTVLRGTLDVPAE